MAKNNEVTSAVAVSQEQIDMAMKHVCEFHASNKNSNHTIGPGYFSYKMGITDDESMCLLNVLASMGYVEYTGSKVKGIHNIKLTDKGRCYFESKAKDEAERHEQFCHDWKVAIFSALAGALLSEPLWKLLRLIAGLIQ